MRTAVETNQPTQARKEYPNGDVFDGIVDGVSGKRRYGTLSLKAEGIQYIGDFVDGEPSGKGTIVYKDRSKFEGEHHNFQLIKGEYRFPDEERHEGVWFCNCPTKEGLRKYKDGRRSQQGMMVVCKGKNSPRFKVNFVINNGMRVVEDWRGTATGAIRESVTFIPVAALQYEEALVRACSTGNTGNVSKVLKTHGILAKFALDSSENKCAPCLVVAAANGFVDVVKILLMNGADADSCDTDMHNAFHAAAFFAHARVLSVLCELKSTSLSVEHAMNARSESGETPLQMAVTAYRQNVPGADECVRLLINAGADPGDLEPSLIVLDPSSLLFNTLLFLVPPPTEVLLQSYLRSNPHSQASHSAESDGVVSKKVD
jgi:hypothetical protein